MKRTYVITVADHVSSKHHRIIRKAIQDEFINIAVDLPGVDDVTNVSVWRKDGRMLNLDDRNCLKLFTRGVLAALAQVHQVEPGLNFKSKQYGQTNQSQ